MEPSSTVDQTVKSVRSVLKITFIILPIAAGFDKFTQILTDWEKYLHPGLAAMLPFTPHTFMIIVGVIEITAGIIVWVNPRIGGFIVMGWLIAIALTLIASGEYLDVAVRDIVMSIGAFSLARLSTVVIRR